MAHKPRIVVSPEVKRAEGEALRKLWKERSKMPQQDFARDVLGKSEGYLATFFQGGRPITVSMAREFAKHLGCDISEFSERLAKEDARLNSLVEWPFPAIKYSEIESLPDWAIPSLQGHIQSWLMRFKTDPANNQSPEIPAEDLASS